MANWSLQQLWALALTRKEFYEVVKMQILFQKIKGTEKENRVVIDKVEQAPRP